MRERLRVLVVEDDPDLVLVMEHELTLAGHTVLVADSAEQALLRVAEADLVLLDFHLPGADGLQFLDQLQRLDVPPSVVMVTGDDLGGLDQEALRAGAIDFVPKRPGYLRALPAIVQRAARQHDLGRRIAAFESVAVDLLAVDDVEAAARAIAHGACRLLGGAHAAMVPVGRDAARPEGAVVVGGAGKLVERLAGMPPREFPSAATASTWDPPAGELGSCVLVRLVPPRSDDGGWLLVVGGMAGSPGSEERQLAESFGRVAAAALDGISRREDGGRALLEGHARAAQDVDRLGRGLREVGEHVRRAHAGVRRVLDEQGVPASLVREVSHVEAHLDAAAEVAGDLVADEDDG